MPVSVTSGLLMSAVSCRLSACCSLVGPHGFGAPLLRRFGNSSASALVFCTFPHFCGHIGADDGSQADHQQGRSKLLLDLFQSFGGELIHPRLQRPGDR